MNFGFSPDEERFRQEVRAFLDKEVTEGVLQEIDSGQGFGPHSWGLLRKLGAKGWLTPSWPKEYGGLGLSHIYRFIIQEELDYYGGLFIGRSTGASIAGPTILLYGSEEQKKEYLPRIARGEIEFALGYTEPQAGSGLAALDIRAVEDGEDYVINGQKCFNTRSHFAQYHWLAARTDPNVPKHRGISLFIVDLSSLGITVRPMWTVGGTRTNEVFYDSVRVPKKNLVGEKNRGFYHIATALDFERGFAVAGLRRDLERLVEYAQQTERDGKLLAHDPLVRQRLAEMAIEVEVAHGFAYRVAWMQTKGVVPNYETTELKLFASEFRQRLNNVGLQIMQLYGLLQTESKWVALRGDIEHRYRDDLMLTIAGGTSEIMRNIIATRGLGLPR